MKLHRVLVLFSAMTLLMAAGPETPSGTRQASCVVDIWSNLDFQHDVNCHQQVKTELCLEYGTMAQEMLGIAPEALQEYITFEPAPSGNPQNPNGFVLGRGSGERSRMMLSLTLDDKAKPAAKEFLQLLVFNLHNVIDRIQDRDIQNQLDDVHTARREAAEQKQRESEYASILKSMGMNGQTTADIEALARSFDEQNLQLSLDAAALSAERDVLSATMDRIGANAGKKAQDDPVAAELETIVSLKEKKLESLRALYKQGNQSSADLSDAEASAADARVQLLERREAVERAAGGDALGDLQKQLIQVEVTLAEGKAKLDAIGKRSASLDSALDFTRQNEVASQQGRRRVDSSDSRLQELQNELGEIPKAAIKVVSEE